MCQCVVYQPALLQGKCRISLLGQPITNHSECRRHRQGLYALPSELKTSYTYLQCAIFSLARNDECEVYETVTVDVEPFYPPFNYRYMCSSFVLSSYIPVYTYTYSLQILQPVFTRILVRYMNHDDVPSLLRPLVPGLTWPHRWKNAGYDPDDAKNDECNVEEASFHASRSCEISNCSEVIRPHFIVCSVVHHIAILIIFSL